MARLTDIIEDFLKEMLEESGGYVEVRRNALADSFKCSPSQINYVLTTRFTPYQGFYVESRRGGRGYIKIIKLEMTEEQLINNILEETIEERITFDKVRHILNGLVKEEILSEKEALMIQHSLDDNALIDINRSDRNLVRASIFKNILLALVRD